MQNYFYQKRDWRPPEPKADQIPTPPRRKLRPKAVVLFCCALALMIGLTAVIALVNRQEPADPLMWPTLPPVSSDQPQPQSGGAATTVERAPVGDGTTLTISPLPEGEVHGFQEIYRENIACVVSVRGRQASGVSLGTGVILSEDGYIVTNSHVIEGCSGVEITLHDETVWKALLVGMDPETDLAVLKIGADGLVPAAFGNSDLLQVGDVVLAIGNPLGENLKGTMTDGIISAINRDVQVDGYTMTLIQTTAALNSGNSGGALINAYGQVVGITNMKMQSYYSTVEGLGFAIPTTTVKKVVDELIDHGYVGGRPVIGVTVRALTAEEKENAGLSGGLWVDEVDPASDAWRQGIRAGDVILAADGGPVATTAELLAAREGLGVGDSIRLRIWRDGEEWDADVLLVEQYQLEG